MLLLFFAMVLNVTSFPVLSKDDNPSHGKMEAGFLRALNEWNEDRTNTTTTLKAKGEMDKFLVHRNLFGGLTSEVRGRLRLLTAANVLAVFRTSRKLRC